MPRRPMRSIVAPMTPEEQHGHFMGLALQEARKAAESGEVPVGAVIVKDRVVIGRAHNQVELLKDPTAHAEMIAITQAASVVGDWRLSDAILYVTKEPCVMCAGAIVSARIAQVCYGTRDPFRGAARSVFQVLDHPNLNHRCQVTGGIMEDECRSLLQGFFKEQREAGKPP